MDGEVRILRLRENSKLEDFSLKPSELIPCLLTINTTRLISLEIRNTGRTPVLNLYSLGFSLAERCAKLTEWAHTVPHKVGTTISPTTTKLEKDGRKLRQVGSSGIDDGAISRALLYIHPAGTCWYLLGEFHICASVLPKPPSCQSRRFNTRLSMPLSRAVRVMRREFLFTNSWALNMPVCRHVLRGPLRSMILLAPSWMLRDMGKYMP